jgi:hypothetical protein
MKSRVLVLVSHIMMMMLLKKVWYDVFIYIFVCLVYFLTWAHNHSGVTDLGRSNGNPKARSQYN